MSLPKCAVQADVPPIDFVPMQMTAIPQVLDIERRLVDYPWSERNFTDSLVAGHDSWLLRGTDDAAESNEIWGYAVLQLVLDEAELLNIGIRSERQRLGLGGRLLEFLCERARSQGAKRMFLEVRESNLAARSLYARHAFIQIGERSNYYPAAHGRETAVLLAKDL